MIGLDGSCDAIRDRHTPEWSANDRTLIDPYHSACVWGPSQYVNVGLSVTVWDETFPIDFWTSLEMINSDDFHS